jgi:hypothetical protein
MCFLTPDWQLAQSATVIATLCWHMGVLLTLQSGQLFRVSGNCVDAVCAEAYYRFG